MFANASAAFAEAMGKVGEATMIQATASTCRLYDIPKLVDLYMTGELLLDELITARRPLDEVAQAITDLASGAQLRQLLIP